MDSVKKNSKKPKSIQNKFSPVLGHGINWWIVALLLGPRTSISGTSCPRFDVLRASKEGDNPPVYCMAQNGAKIYICTFFTLAQHVAFNYLNIHGYSTN